MYSLSTIIDKAKLFGIPLTHATIGSDLCQCWIDRVALAISLYDSHCIERWREACADAARYATAA